ncbi:MAG: hydrogenase maturation protease [Pseudonocardia sp.]
MTGRVLVAGVGDMTLSDDGFGVEVVRRLTERGGLPEGIELVDVGLRARDLAYRLLDGYAALVLVDAISRGGEPGTLYALEHELTGAPSPIGPSLGGGHEIDPDVVLAMIGELAAAMGVERPVERVVVVACEAASFEEAIGLSPPVAAAVDRAVTATAEIATELLAHEERSTHVPGNPG